MTACLLLRVLLCRQLADVFVDPGRECRSCSSNATTIESCQGWTYSFSFDNVRCQCNRGKPMMLAFELGGSVK